MSADQGTQTPTADTIYLNGCEIFCEVGGSGEPLVFVHGGFPNLLTALRCEEAIDWDWSWERDFAKRYRFISYDRRGCYRSSSPTDGYDLENQATDLQ